MTSDDELANNPRFREAVQLTAYFLWEQDGRPHGRADDYWRRAWEKHFSELRYNRWLDEEPQDGNS